MSVEEKTGNWTAERLRLALPAIRGLLVAHVLVLSSGSDERAEASGADEGTARAAVRTGEAGKSPAKASFGPVIVRQLSAWLYATENRVLDLDDGRLLSVPTDLNLVGMNNPRPLLNWMVTEGADLIVSGGNSLTNLSFQVDDGCLALFGEKSTFDSIAASELPDQLARAGVFQHLYIPQLAPGHGAVLAFKTREGGVGVLQVLSYTKSPQPAVTIRYKLVQQPERSAQGMKRIIGTSQTQDTSPPASAAGGVLREAARAQRNFKPDALRNK